MTSLASRRPCRSRFHLGLALVSLVVTASCARATAPEAELKSPPASAAAAEAPASLEQAEAELEQARAELEQVQGEREKLALNQAPAAGASPPAPVTTQAARGAGAVESEAARPEPPKPAAKKAESRELDAAKDDAAPEEAPANQLGSCERSCKAFGSLRRARDAICRLDEQGGTRCSRADGVVRDAESKVQSCGCLR